MKKNIISAVAKNGVIGKHNGEIPWHISEEFKHFKETTLGYPIIMGRKSFDALGKPLPKRLNIIISRNKKLSYPFENIKIFYSLDDAYKFCDNNKYEKIFIIGGGEIYAQALNDVDEMIISRLNFEAEGDVFFPKFDEDNWSVVKKDKRDEFEIYWYKRKSTVKVK